MAVKDRVKTYRERMRARGMRPIQLWVPDVRSERFADEAARQCALVVASETAGDDQCFVEAVSIPWDGSES